MLVVCLGYYVDYCFSNLDYIISEHLATLITVCFHIGIDMGDRYLRALRIIIN